MADERGFIGMLDWGIGGLGCYRALARRRPELAVVYLSDSGAVPYGKLPRAALQARVEGAIRLLEAHGAAQVLIACNAASTVLAEVRANVPVLGVIEAAIASVPDDLTGTLGVLGGVRTIRSGLYRRLARPGRVVSGRIAQPLSAHVEAGTTHTPRFGAELARIMRPLRHADALLLACTHYPAIATAIAAQAPEARLFDPAETLAERALSRFGANAVEGRLSLLTTGDPAAMRSAGAQAWQLALGPVTRVSLECAARGPSS